MIIKNKNYQSDYFGQILERICRSKNKKIKKMPFVTVAFAQSLDGCISLSSRQPVTLSSRVSLELTHYLRANHDAILIGINTLIYDDPLLTVRLIDGDNPQPIVVDSHLRFPSTARLMQNTRKPWIATTGSFNPQQNELLKGKGAGILHVPQLSNGWVDLEKLLVRLYNMGIRSLMVEGGACILSSFVQKGLSDFLVLNISPVLLGGLKGFQILDSNSNKLFRAMRDVQFLKTDEELIAAGEFCWEN